MHAFVISGGSPEKRQTEIQKKIEEWNVSLFDQIVLTREETSIGVSEVRSFQQRLQLSPLQGSYTAGIIQNAQLLTTEAQNALLKILEEPPPHARLILEAPGTQSLLATILSRCQVMNCGEVKGYSDEEINKVLADIQNLQKTTKTGERVKVIDTLAPTREDAKLWVEKAIIASRNLLKTVILGSEATPESQEMLDETSMTLQQITHLLRRLLDAQRQLAANVTPKLVLDAVFLN